MEELEQSWFGGKSTWQWHVKWTKGRRWDKCGEWYSSCYNRWRKRSQDLNQCNGARSITGLGSTGYCQDIRCLHQFPTKSFKSETTSRGTPWVLSWPPSVTHRLPAALVSKEGETRDSLEQCMGMQTEPFPVMGSLAWEAKMTSSTWTMNQATSNVKDSLVHSKLQYCQFYSPMNHSPRIHTQPESYFLFQFPLY